SSQPAGAMSFFMHVSQVFVVTKSPALWAPGSQSVWRRLAVGDVADHAHGERRIDRERFLHVDADLALAGRDGPVDLVVVLPGFDFRDIGDFVRLILGRQVFAPADDGAGRG